MLQHICKIILCLFHVNKNIAEELDLHGIYSKKPLILDLTISRFSRLIFPWEISRQQISRFPVSREKMRCLMDMHGSLYSSCLSRETDLCDISIKLSQPARGDLKNLRELPSLWFYASFRNFKIQFCLVSSVGCNFALKKEPPSGWAEKLFRWPGL